MFTYPGERDIAIRSGCIGGEERRDEIGDWARDSCSERRGGVRERSLGRWLLSLGILDGISLGGELTRLS